MTSRQEATSPLPLIPEFTIADRLRKARELTDLDMRAFAAEIDSSLSTVSNYEMSRYTRQRKTIVLKRWALATGVSLDWLMTGEDPGPDDPHGGNEQGIPSSECVTGDSALILEFPTEWVDEQRAA